MKNDLFMKTILTLVAISTSVLAFDKVYNAFVPPAQAAPYLSEVQMQAIEINYKVAILSIKQTEMCISALGIQEESCQMLYKASMKQSRFVTDMITTQVTK